MPSLAARPCSTPGCRNTSSKGSQCTDCDKANQKARGLYRGSAHERGYDERHRSLRILAFQRDHWQCVDCGWRPQLVVDCETYGLDEPPPQVVIESLRIAFNRGEKHLQGDHIIPFENRPEKRLDLDNIATRCNVCHNIKTKRGQ